MQADMMHHSPLEAAGTRSVARIDGAHRRCRHGAPQRRQRGLARRHGARPCRDWVLSRRRFLQYAALASAAALPHARAAAGQPAAPPTPPLVDTHLHLWDLERFELPWIEKDGPLNRSFLLSDYLAAADRLNIQQCVYMEVDVRPDQQSAEIEYITSLCQQEGPLAAMVVSGRPAEDGFAAYLRRHAENPYIRGLRQVLHTPATPRGYMLERAFVRGIRLLGEAGWHFELCLRPGELADAAKLADLCPDTRFVLDHCGNASVLEKNLDPWRRDLARLAEREHVSAKISGIIASGTMGRWSIENLAPIIDHTLDCFGPDRVVFGSDWPVCTLAASLRKWVEALYAIVRRRGDAEQRKLFSENARRIYRLA
jgi:predicted TIM-barrel fold metal-dependent hydrolase